MAVVAYLRRYGNGWAVMYSWATFGLLIVCHRRFGGRMGKEPNLDLVLARIPYRECVACARDLSFQPAAGPFGWIPGEVPRPRASLGPILLVLG